MTVARSRTRSTERRWLVLSTDGRHTTIGRATDPTPNEITALETALAAQGLAGWLAIAEGDYHAIRDPMHLMIVRELGNPGVAFSDAVAAFERIRSSR
ncbi:hypothetical protein [Limobrevibacterium gyesilva]|uniref:Uncharacterized protein n=1 Tax=Limobrevibacterium gyesilva TaxID=2991712 RepID=A0AA41YQK0_9PROT|nr:hypothetical protein [Limobrevibacterium gyesilva]MCW3476752.1 hypothetical protein [Limobrevibacterium gyesilva]